MTDETFDDDDTYEVGYGKPPKHTQFKKGQSGNPSGKSGKEPSIKAKLAKLISKDVLAQKNGSTVAIKRVDAMIETLATKAMKGDLQALKFIVELLGADAVDGPSSPHLETTKADLQTLKSHADWIAICEKAQAEVNQTETEEER